MAKETCSNRVFGVLFSLQLGVKSLSLFHNGSVLKLPVKAGQNKAAGEAGGDVGNNFSLQSSGDWGNGRHFLKRMNSSNKVFFCRGAMRYLQGQRWDNFFLTFSEARSQ